MSLSNSTHYSQKVLLRQYFAIEQFLYHLVCFRTINKKIHGSQINHSFWIATNDAHILQASILWSMVFGNENTSQIHWKKLLTEKAEEREKEFRSGLFFSLKIDANSWLEYWKEMKHFRDNFAAHRALKFDEPVPKFNMAVDASFYYDDWVRKIISPDTLDMPKLSRRIEIYESDVSRLLENLFESSKGVPES